jgi:dipeptidyl aminopeptidase/acylaminoacyl peptidase
VAEVARGVRVLESQRSTMASVSTTGTLVFASSEVGRFRLEAFDRQGRSLGPLPIARGDFHQLEVSPDGGRLAYVSVREGQGDIWVHDFATGTSQPLTSSAEYDEVPTWSSDGKELIFRSGSMAAEAMMRLRVDGEMAPRRLAIGPKAIQSGLLSIGVWLSDEWGIGVVRNADGTNGFAAIGLKDASRYEPLPGAVEVGPRGPNYSQAARAIAFASTATGTSEGFVVSVEADHDGVRVGSDRQRLPIEGARSIRWRQDGRELYAVAADGALWTVPVARRDGALRLGAATKLFAGSFIDGDFAVTDDGERFLFRVDPAAAHQTLSVILDWPARIAGAQK